MVRQFSKFKIGISVIAFVAGCSVQPNATRMDTPQSLSGSKVARLDASFKRTVNSVVYFSFDEDRLTKSAIAKLDEQAKWILDHPGLKFSVTGHTDKVGNQAYNFGLGMRRAQRVLAYLVAKGIDPDRLIAMVSMGEDDPAIDTEQRALANRRVVTEVVGIVPSARPIASNDGGDSPFRTSNLSPVPSETSDTNQPDDDNDGQRVDAGRGNGDEGGDPGNSGGHNNGGDEDVTQSADTGADDNGNGNGNGNGGNNSPQGSSNQDDNRPNAGRGNGDEGGDPGNSGDHNNGGDEVPAQ